MNIQKRIYKYHEQKNKIHHHISHISDSSTFIGYWMDENTFILKHKNFLVPFSLEGNIAEVEEKNKLKILVTAGYRYLMLYILPAGLFLYGLLKWPRDPEKGMLLVFTGISLSIFIFLFSSVIMNNLKKSFKEALNII
jgi:hypothetical protein